MPPLDAAGSLLGRWPARRAPGARAGASSPLSALAARAQAGDDGAFDELMKETEERVISIGWRFLGTRDRAVDAAQETYLRAYRHLARFRLDRDFEAWVCRIAVNVCRDVYRRTKAGPSGVPPASWEGEREAGRLAEPSSASDSEASLLEVERRRLLLEAIAALPPRERAAIVLRDLEGLSSERAAKVLGSRACTVRSQVAAARMKLKRALEPRIGRNR